MKKIPCYIIGILILVFCTNQQTENKATPMDVQESNQDSTEIQLLGSYLNSKIDEPFVDLPLDSGKMVCVDDRRLWHNATDITPVDCTRPGYMDSLILTAEK